MFGSECAIFVEDFRVFGDPGGELRVYASRGEEYTRLNVISHACWRPSMLRYYGCRGGSPWASPIPPRQLEMGAGADVRSMILLENRLRFLANSGRCTLAQPSCEKYIYLQ